MLCAGNLSQLRGSPPHWHLGMVNCLIIKLLPNLPPFIVSCRFTLIFLLSFLPTPLIKPYSLEQNIGIAVASMPALRQLLTDRKKQHPSHSSEPLCNHNSDTRTPLNAFPSLAYSNCIRLADDDYPGETSSREYSTPTPKTDDVEKCHDRRVSVIRPGMASLPTWTERKISLAETVEMSRVSPKPTFVERKPSTAETLRLSMMTPSWGSAVRKPSSADKPCTTSNKRLSMVSPLSLDKPAPLFSAGRMQQLGRFEETGLRNSRVATPEEIMTLGNPAAMVRIRGAPYSPPLKGYEQMSLKTCLLSLYDSRDSAQGSLYSPQRSKD